MLPDPLHPAVVHFPIVLAVLIPPLALLVVWAIRSGHVPARAWLSVVVLQLLLWGAAWAALETGESDEERVERAVAERYIEDHEDSAERFLLLALLGIPIAVVGLLRGMPGAVAQVLTVFVALAALGAVAITGHSGGELVYRHGAASAYASVAPRGQEGRWAYSERDDDDDEYEDDD